MQGDTRTVFRGKVREDLGAKGVGTKVTSRLGCSLRLGLLSPLAYHPNTVGVVCGLYSIGWGWREDRGGRGQSWGLEKGVPGCM